jgi:hypothetical protein
MLASMMPMARQTPMSCFVEWAADRKVDLTLVSDNNNDNHLGDYELELVDNDEIVQQIILVILFILNIAR